MKANAASVAVSNAVIQNHLADALPRPLMAQVTLPHPSATSSARSFDVLVNAPAGDAGRRRQPVLCRHHRLLRQHEPGMKMSHDATFVVPLPKSLQAFSRAEHAGRAEKRQAGRDQHTTLNIRLVPSHGQSGPAPTIKAVSVGAS